MMIFIIIEAILLIVLTGMNIYSVNIIRKMNKKMNRLARHICRSDGDDWNFICRNW